MGYVICNVGNTIDKEKRKLRNCKVKIDLEVHFRSAVRWVVGRCGVGGNRYAHGWLV